MTRYLLDTNHLSAALNAKSGILEKVRDVLLRGDRIGTCAPALCELQAGLVLTARREHNQQLLQELLKQVRIWPLDLRTAEIYGELYHELRRMGRVLSQADMMMAALAKQIDATLVSTDRDFEPIQGLPLESWYQK